MAGTSTPQLAAAVTNAGALGSLPFGAVDAPTARILIEATRAGTGGPFNVNLFCHQPARVNSAREAVWLDALAPSFAEFGATPPSTLREIYTTFNDNDAMLRLLLEFRPAVVSFHFGLPPTETIRALRGAGICLLATVTNLTEVKIVTAAGIDGLVAQGYEAGGHRGLFDPAAADERLDTKSLVSRLVSKTTLPVIAAGGIMTGADIAAFLALGAQAVQMGTAFIACPESSADADFRQALFGSGAAHTTMTSAISGRPARCLANRFTELAQDLAHLTPPDYPIAYDAGKALHQAAKAAGEGGFGAQWAGQGAPSARALSAADLIRVLEAEWQAVRRAVHT